MKGQEKLLWHTTSKKIIRNVMEEGQMSVLGWKIFVKALQLKISELGIDVKMRDWSWDEVVEVHGPGLGDYGKVLGFILREMGNIKGFK